MLHWGVLLKSIDIPQIQLSLAMITDTSHEDLDAHDLFAHVERNLINICRGEKCFLQTL
jgi:hypothetical protein